MNLETWLEAAVADAQRRGMPDLRPLLEALIQAARVLRDADWNENASTGSRIDRRLP